MIWLRTIWYILRLRCEEADRLRSVAARGGLSRSELLAERVHRSLCSGCRRAARQLARIDRALEQLAEGAGDGPGWDPARAARLDDALRRARDEA